jgi:hypothetical protein
MRGLLDVNVLIALLDSGHSCHGLAMRWLEDEIAHGWASCPLTQNGCVRIMSHSSYLGALPATQVASRLGEAASEQDHEFWADDISLVEAEHIEWSRVLGSRQVTDVYLLALAVQHGGRLVTLDRRIPLAAVSSARPEHLVVIS